MAVTVRQLEQVNAVHIPVDNFGSRCFTVN